MAEKLECPECYAPIAPDDFQCEHCELLLNPQHASGEYVITDPSIVRALISPPARTTSREIPAIPPRPSEDEDITARFTLPLEEDTVPYLTAGMDLALHPLPPFDAYVASFIDGMQTVAALSRSARVPEVEIKVVLKSLLEQGLVELHRQPAPPSPEDAVPLLNGVDFLEEPSSNASDREPEPLPPPPPAPTRPEPPPARILYSTPPPIPRPATPPPLPAPPIPPLPLPTVAAPQAPIAPPRPLERTEDFLQRAVRLEREGQVDRAIELLKRGLARSSSPAPLYNKLALILVNQRKDFAQASELLERAVKLEPNNPVFQQNLLKVVSLAASHPDSREKKSRGLLDRLTGRNNN